MAHPVLDRTIASIHAETARQGVPISELYIPYADWVDLVKEAREMPWQPPLPDDELTELPLIGVMVKPNVA